MIEPVKNIETIYVFEGEVKPDDLKKVKPSKHPMVYYALPKDSALERVFRSVLKGVSQVIEIEALGDLKNVISYMVPYGRQIDAVTDAIGAVIKQQTNTNEKRGNMNWIVDRLQEKSTWRGIVTALTALGITISPEITEGIIALGIALFGLVEIIGKDEKANAK